MKIQIRQECIIIEQIIVALRTRMTVDTKLSRIRVEMRERKRSTHVEPATDPTGIRSRRPSISCQMRTSESTGMLCDMRSGLSIFRPGCAPPVASSRISI
jgi:hypothetical protein